MKEQLNLLRGIQLLDLDTDTVTGKVSRLREKLNEYRGAFDSLTANLEQQRQELDESRALRREKEADLQNLQERQKKSKQKLQSVTTMKEQTAAEQEVESISRNITQIEGEYLELDEAIQNFETSIAEEGNKVEQLSAIIRESELEVEQAVLASKASLKKVVGKRKQFEKKLDAYTMRQYEFIRSRRGGEALVAAKGGHCTGCYMALPPQLFNEIQRGDSLKMCPSCQRILYFEPESEEAE